MFDTSNSLLQHLQDPNCLFQGAKIVVKRDDLIDEWVSGNKWRKLKHNIAAAQGAKQNRILTFGGAFSNHLLATAKACHLAGMESIGIVRGEELNERSNETLKNCFALGMELVFISREEYHLRDDKSYIEQLHIDYPNTYIVPEGGANFYGLIGCQEIWKELPKDYTDVVVAAGTGTTAAGILSGMPHTMKLHVFSALKGDFLEKEIENKIHFAFHNEGFTSSCMKQMKLYSEDVFGGYGKCNQQLLDFIIWVKDTFDLPLDQVYTAKAFYRLYKMIQSGEFDARSRILFVHTGGLQGNTAFSDSSLV
jgi:1-aminocyclopropane-1-carboxylate deaminase/D-cysteine desulfhydrase-like pyridoxal-dependent ACC family enzyme